MCLLGFNALCVNHLHTGTKCNNGLIFPCLIAHKHSHHTKRIYIYSFICIQFSDNNLMIKSYYAGCLVV